MIPFAQCFARNHCWRVAVLTMLLVATIGLAGCASSHLVLNSDGTISATLEVVPGTDGVEKKVKDLQNAMKKACENGQFKMAIFTPEQNLIGTDEVKKFLSVLKELKGLLGKTTVTLSGYCIEVRRQTSP